MKKVKQKTTEQLHDEIMALFIGQDMGTTLNALIETMVGVSNYLEVKPYDVVNLVVAELNIYEEMDKEWNKLQQHWLKHKRHLGQL